MTVASLLSQVADLAVPLIYVTSILYVITCNLDVNSINYVIIYDLSCFLLGLTFVTCSVSWS